MDLCSDPQQTRKRLFKSRNCMFKLQDGETTRIFELLRELWGVNEGVAMEKYNSKHEGYSMILENVDDANSDLNVIVENLGNLWYAIKTEDDTSDYAEIIEKYALSCAAVLNLVAETARNFQDSFKPEEKKITLNPFDNTIEEVKKIMKNAAGMGIKEE